MIEAKFTDGNWKVDKSYETMLMVSTENGLPISQVECEKGEDEFGPVIRPSIESLANAHLIAAAPKMYGALETILELGKLSPHQEDIVSKILAKARGEK